MDGMSDALDKAEQAVRDAETDTAAVQLAMAAMELAKLATLQQAQQASQQKACQHDHPKARRGTGEWIGIACAVCVGSVGLAFASLALAILGGVAAIVVLVLRDLWRDMQRKGR
jgi:alkylation response protein AidB-like acyl-CoA dehydrogenase